MNGEFRKGIGKNIVAVSPKECDFSLKRLRVMNFDSQPCFWVS
jgi:hypothetical protein